MFSQNDIEQITRRGMIPDQALAQLGRFRKGFPALQLDRPATVGDGILRPDSHELATLSAAFEEGMAGRRIIKFVPASGAATRMFREVFDWREQLESGMDNESLLERNPAARLFFARMKDFAFWEDLMLCMDKEDLHAGHLLESGNYLPLIDFLLTDKGLDYASLPKALLLFHRYGDHCRTALEEHLVEAALYAAGPEGVARLHFTVSPQHLELFKNLLSKRLPHYEDHYRLRFEIGFSEQQPHTDTLAADQGNKPFRDADGKLVFRPGGHGALLNNLDALQEDVIFIKNIDNVVPDRCRTSTTVYKKVLGGLLLRTQYDQHRWLHRLDKGPLSEAEREAAVAFAVQALQADPAMFADGPDESVHHLKQLLNRPLRVCGMVRNQGEPGGGPFWVRDPGTSFLSLQIVESAQVDSSDPDQVACLARSTHFNPVDLVCAVKDHKGRKYNLPEFVDNETGFISQKSKDGRGLQALELPGLWNGAMAGWNTLFVEVPLDTFNPVKSVNDLLREAHQ